MRLGAIDVKLTCIVTVRSTGHSGVRVWLNGAIGVVTVLPFKALRRGDLSLPKSAKKSAQSLPSIPTWEGAQSHLIVSCEQCHTCSTSFQRSACATTPDRNTQCDSFH